MCVTGRLYGGRFLPLNSPYVGNAQFIGDLSISVRWLFALEKCLQPKKPWCAEKGEGWGEFRMRCLDASISPILFCACFPHNMITRFFLPLLRVEITSSVKYSHPFPAWEFARFACTVKTVLSKNTPCSAHDVKQPWLGIGHLRSLLSSLKILTSEVGAAMPWSTEKHRPCAWFGPWYGSCPNITTRTSWNGVRENALKTSLPLGYTV